MFLSHYSTDWRALADFFTESATINFTLCPCTQTLVMPYSPSALLKSRFLGMLSQWERHARPRATINGILDTKQIGLLSRSLSSTQGLSWEDFLLAPTYSPLFYAVNWTWENEVASESRRSNQPPLVLSSVHCLSTMPILHTSRP